MGLIEELPKEVEKERFAEFLEQVRQDFPDGELNIQYQETDSNALVLGTGRLSECARQTARTLKEQLKLKDRQLQLQMLRPPKRGFLARQDL